MRALAALAASVALASVACSAGGENRFGPEPDYDAIEQRLAAPQGSFDAREAASLFARYEDERRSTEEIDLGGGDRSHAASRAGVRSQALHLLELAERGMSTTPRCSAIEHGDTRGSCACPDGGSFAYDFSDMRAAQKAHGPADVALKVLFEECRNADRTVSGREVVRLHLDPLDAGGPKLDPSRATMLLVTELDVTRGTEQRAIDLASRITNGAFELALAVKDGWITVRADGSSYVVRAKDGTWTCSASAATTCTRAF